MYNYRCYQQQVVQPMLPSVITPEECGFSQSMMRSQVVGKTVSDFFCKDPDNPFVEVQRVDSVVLQGIQ